MLIPILPGFATKHLGLSHANYSYMMICRWNINHCFLIPIGKLSDRIGGFYVASFYFLFPASNYKEVEPAQAIK
jgi:hypothetical protein